MKMQALKIIENKLINLYENAPKNKDYRVPALWISPFKSADTAFLEVNPYSYFLEQINNIYSNAGERDSAELPFVYNMLLRHATAFNHDDGASKFTQSGFRKNGTFLKAIALLPYIKSLGVNTVYLLPITAIGIDGRKGSLGSPYAIKNPYLLDENLAEPLLNISVEQQFAAFVEAAHHLGMNVVLEFVFRTASIDSDLAIEHPNWFYWLKKNIKDRKFNEIDRNKYGAPYFTDEELLKIKKNIEKGDLEKLITPHRNYKNFFVEPPEKAVLRDGKIVGLTNGEEYCRIPSAFADWPPNDTQPPWSDVTYLKLYDNSDFNYIAYNTVRMYDKRLASPKNIVKDLWNSICGIIPYFQTQFDIDGVLLDMGHSLPSELRAKITEDARKINKDFSFWEENFSLDEKSVRDGYDAVVGYLPFDAHIPSKYNDLIRRLATSGSPLPFFATSETHNTPRTAARGHNIALSKLVWTINCFLPAILFIHSGFELGEKTPVNTGLGFSPDEQRKFPADILPLFSDARLCWGDNSQWTEYLRKIVEIRNYFYDIIANQKPETIVPLSVNSDKSIAFLRCSDDKTLYLLVAASMNPNESIILEIKLKNKVAKFFDLINGRIYETDNGIMSINIEPFQAVSGEIVFMNAISNLAI